ncbi:MAG: hypothetical protein M1814_006408 [Vezdaea aestivalis]|nr:MAG: hypothetical protein M1814_006408 [Vezdaea aestivalis]
MNNASASPWPDSTTQDPMHPAGAAGGDSDFNFLDLADFNLDFTTFEPTGSADQHMQDASDSLMETPMEVLAATTDPRIPHNVAMDNHMQTGDPITHHATLMDMTLRQQLYHQQQHHPQGARYMHSSAIPPTPNSIELNGGANRYYAPIDQQQLMDRYSRMKDDQMIFTPLVSPAVTPLEATFNIPEYTVPGAYLSPLTSPALEAQQQNAHRSVYNSGRSSDNSIGASPIDVNIDDNPEVANGPAKKARRKMSAPTQTRVSSRLLRQSPSVKAQRRKNASGSMSSAELKATVDARRRSGLSKTTKNKLSTPFAHDSSEAESISPEPLSESVMAPPPAPRPSGHSPFLAPHRSLIPNGLSPATPASLMRLPPSQLPQALQIVSSPTCLTPRSVDTVPTTTLPEAAIPTRPTLARVDTNFTDGQITPTLDSAKTPNFRPLTASTAPTSACVSPRINGSPTITRKTESKPAVRQSKKRNSTSASSASVQVSPALRPRISPSIKPLSSTNSPHQAVSAETSALLLASKSNYQNILEGTHLPGVSYPEALSTNLTSKRTSHKIAEQGRRNRINTALKEMETLLLSNAPEKSPRLHTNGTVATAASPTNGVEGKKTTSPSATPTPTPHPTPLISTAPTINDAITASSEESKPPTATNGALPPNASPPIGPSGPGLSGNSKASTVEMAIEYIKQLQQEVLEARGRAERAEEELRLVKAETL